MIPAIPAFVTVILVVSQPVIALVVWRIVAAGAPKPVRAALAVGLFGWIGLAFALAPAPASLAGRDPFYLTPLIPLFAVVSFAVALLAWSRSAKFRQAIDSAPLPALIAVQFYRVLGALFLILYGVGQLPARFALPAGWGDVAIGLAAPLVGLALARGLPGARRLAIAWNVLGLLDLVVAVGMGTGLLAPYLVPSLGTRVPPAAAMGVFPTILVPIFAVPLSIMLHLAALRRLRRQGGPAGRPLAWSAS